MPGCWSRGQRPCFLASTRLPGASALDLTHDPFPLGTLFRSLLLQGEYMRLSMGTSSGIDHAGHLTGLLFGATTLACVRLVGSTGSGGGSRALGSRGS